jgi:hypothetical protein
VFSYSSCIVGYSSIATIGLRPLPTIWVGKRGVRFVLPVTRNFAESLRWDWPRRLLPAPDLNSVERQNRAVLQLLPPRNKHLEVFSWLR